MATCPQCTAKTKTGERCKRTTCRYAPFCAAHRAFTIDESTLPGAGKGIFASRPLKRSDTIGDYIIATTKQNETEFLESYPDSRATHSAKITALTSRLWGQAEGRTMVSGWGIERHRADETTLKS